MEALRAFGGRSVCVFVLDWLMDDVDDVCYSSTPADRYRSAFTEKCML